MLKPDLPGVPPKAPSVFYANANDNHLINQMNILSTLLMGRPGEEQRAMIDSSLSWPYSLLLQRDGAGGISATLISRNISSSIRAKCSRALLDPGP